jgi:hypothetical protein
MPTYLGRFGGYLVFGISVPVVEIIILLIYCCGIVHCCVTPLKEVPVVKESNNIVSMCRCGFIADSGEDVRLLLSLCESNNNRQGDVACCVRIMSRCVDLFFVEGFWFEARAVEAILF